MPLDRMIVVWHGVVEMEGDMNTEITEPVVRKLLDVVDECLSTYAEAIVQILIDMKAPGCQWLPLTEQS